jgi:hypothetical protein
MSETERLKLAVLALLTLPLKLAWKLHPDSALPYDKVPVHNMFPFLDMPITMPTYYSLVCTNLVFLIWTYIAFRFFPQFKAFTVLLTLQALTTVEYFLNYNEAYGSFQMFGYTIEVGLYLFKMIVPCVVFIIEVVIWRRR